MKEFKSFAVYLLRTTYIPSYITIDTMIANYHVLNVKDFKDAKFDIWGKVINLAAKAFKVQSKSTNSTTSKKNQRRIVKWKKTNSPISST